MTITWFRLELGSQTLEPDCRESHLSRRDHQMSKPETTTLRGELPGVKLAGSTGATAEVYTHGAHLASWKTADGVEQLFVSSDVREPESQPRPPGRNTSIECRPGAYPR